MGKKILIVDDEQVNREVARLLLEETGLVIEMARDGQEAVDMARGRDYA